MVVENGQDHFRAVDHADTEVIFDVARLDRIEFLVHDQDICLRLAHFVGQIFQKTFSKIGRPLRLVTLLGVFAQNLDSGRVGQAFQFV